MHPKYWKRPQVLRAPADSEGGMGAGGGALDTNQAADAFSSFFSGESQEETVASQGAAEVTESPEAAAERLLAEDANQNEPAEDENKQDAPEAETFTVEIDGKEVKLTKEQIAENHKNGLRQQDYTRKTMEAAEQRKTADAEIQRTRAERENYAQQLHNYAITSESILAEQAKVLTEELLRNDPVEYMAQERTFRLRQADLTKAQTELQRINGERHQEQTEAQANFQREQFEHLKAKIPAFSDPVKGKVESERIKGYLADSPDLAFSSQEIGMFADHRLILLADRAQKYDALMARAKEAAGKVAKAPPKVERPGTAQVAATDGRTKAMRTLKSTGSINDAAAAFGMLD